MGLSKVATPLLLLLLAGLAAGHRPMQAQDLVGSNLNNPQCDACIVVGRILSDYLCDFEAVAWAADKATQLICSQMDDKEQCEQMVFVLLPLAIEYARTSVTPEAACGFLGMCGGDAMTVPSAAAQKLHAMHANSAECAQCRYMSSAMQAAGSKASRPAVAKQACAALPPVLADSCNLLLDKSGPLLSRLASFDRACELSGPCTWGALDALFGLPQGQPAPQLRQLSGLLRTTLAQQGGALQLPGDANTCDKCKLTVLEARMLINSATVQQGIINVTRSLCDYLAPYEALCRASIDTYAPAMFSLIDKYFQPDMVCGTLLHMCPTQQRGTQMAKLQAAHRQGVAWDLLERLQELLQWPAKAWA